MLEFTGTLQEATEVDGNYEDITADSPHTVPTTQTMRFYRAQQ
jgi:hypothetical protein